MRPKDQNPEPSAPESEERPVEVPEEEAGPAGSRDDLSSEQGPLDWKDKYVRLLADFENHRRHAEAERDRLSGLGKEAVLSDIFPVIEHLEKALSAGRSVAGSDGLLKGVEIVYREFLNVLEKHGVERISAVGEAFDPSLHEAVATVPSDAHPEGVIVEEVRPGFLRKGKLLRPAGVVVAR